MYVLTPKLILKEKRKKRITNLCSFHLVKIGLHRYFSKHAPHYQIEMNKGQLYL